MSCTDALNCSDTAEILIKQPNKLTASLSDTDAVKCFEDSNGVAKIIVSGGNYPYSYNWEALPIN
ncbi:MAG: SprB repeat-containing protein [Bacteroidetes bacterium]|nr:SprB repeat-containing protein [Bacteroidota bacterium]